ncbi:MAG TPA: hypothetical protein VGK16_09645 [Candidatus Limnocylindrales bacterium]
MHLQIAGSPDDTATNIRAVVSALAGARVNIEGIGPEFNPPHVRVAVRHAEPYDPDDATDPFNIALDAMVKAGLAPAIKPAVAVTLPNKPGALEAVLNRLMREGYAAESILVLAGGTAGATQVQFGVASTMIAGWDQESDRVGEAIVRDLDRL